MEKMKKVLRVVFVVFAIVWTVLLFMTIDNTNTRGDGVRPISSVTALVMGYRINQMCADMAEEECHGGIVVLSLYYPSMAPWAITNYEVRNWLRENGEFLYWIDGVVGIILIVVLIVMFVKELKKTKKKTTRRTTPSSHCHGNCGCDGNCGNNCKCK